jgi:dTDP-4-dehydrorhamnose reductase
MNRNILILGDGLLGSELKKQTNWDIHSRKSGFDIENIEKTIGDIPNVLVNCIAHTDTYSNDKQKHWDVNYKFVSDLVEFCNTHKIKLVHISTDYIYAHSKPNASEDDVPVHCCNWYGYTKLLADGYVQLKSNDYLLIRGTHKEYPFKYDSAWVDQVGNFDYVNVITDIIRKLIDMGCSGIYNVGTDLKSMYELATKTKEVNPIHKPDNVPYDLSLNLNKLNKII